MDVENGALKIPQGNSEGNDRGVGENQWVSLTRQLEKGLWQPQGTGDGQLPGRVGPAEVGLVAAEQLKCLSPHN